MDDRRPVSVTVDPGPFDWVVLRRGGLVVSIPTRTTEPESTSPPPPRWIPPPTPPPARAVRIALFDDEVSELVWRPADALGDAESVPLDAHIGERAGQRTTVVIRVQGTNLVDFDEETLGHHLADAVKAGADIVIRLED